MSKSKLGISSFDLNIKFKDRNEAYKYAKRLKEFIRYMCKKNANKGWSAGAMICVSNIKGNSSYVYYKHNGKVGRPSKVREKHLFENNIEVKWHLHILLVSKPLYAFRDEIKKYIDKNWVEVEKEEKEFDIKKIIESGKTYKKDTNIKKAEYFINQANDILFCNYNYSNDIVIPKGYSLKDLYNAYMNSRTALIYHRKMTTNKRLALDEKYDNIVRFYLNLTKEQDNKMVDKFMKEMQLIKIAENYERIESNKGQENLSIRRRRMPEDSWF